MKYFFPKKNICICISVQKICSILRRYLLEDLDHNTECTLVAGSRSDSGPGTINIGRTHEGRENPGFWSRFWSISTSQSISIFLSISTYSFIPAYHSQAWSVSPSQSIPTPESSISNQSRGKALSHAFYTVLTLARLQEIARLELFFKTVPLILESYLWKIIEHSTIEVKQEMRYFALVWVSPNMCCKKLVCTFANHFYEFHSIML